MIPRLAAADRSKQIRHDRLQRTLHGRRRRDSPRLDGLRSTGTENLHRDVAGGRDAKRRRILGSRATNTGATCRRPEEVGHARLAPQFDTFSHFGIFVMPEAIAGWRDRRLRVGLGDDGSAVVSTVRAPCAFAGQLRQAQCPCASVLATLPMQAC